MIAEEKAKELFSKFNNWTETSQETKDLCEIVIDEILKEIQPNDPNDYCSPLVKTRANLWVEIKKEIQKL